MAATPVARAKASSAATADAQASAVAETVTKGVNRREFLYYIWGASMALLLASSGGALVWFMLPRFREGEFGGIFRIDASTVPAKNATPVGNPAGKFWLYQSDKGVIALSMVCTHLGCLFKWVSANNRFECPCHGSKFTAAGKFIEGPAPRSLDHFEVIIGANRSDAKGGPVELGTATVVSINTGKKVKGVSNGASEG